MFEELSNKLQEISNKISNKGFLNEENIVSALQEVKIALLEADVNFRVVNSFLKKVKEKAKGTEVIGQLSAGQQLIKVIHQELTLLLGGENQQIDLNQKGICNIMLVGLQGSGKTTSAAKLALYLKKKGRKVLLVPADIYRPAAIDQLKVLAEGIEVDCYNSSPKTPVQEIVKAAQAQAKKESYTAIIVDTAGRLQVDEKLMQELEEIKKAVHFQNTLLVLDAMTGQEALNIARAFNEKLELSGFFLSKMDGDARGGAAVSIRAITEKPIMYVGIGEKAENLEDFHPDRIASKVLGMGDVLTLVEKASKQFEGQDLKSLEQRIKKNQFTLLDFQKQLEQLQKMGSLKSLIGMMPGLKIPAGQQIDDKPMKKFNSILTSMTIREKIEHHIINGSRRKRIAKGSGTEVSDINQMLKQFESMKKMMKQMAGGGKKQAMQQMQQMFGGKAGMPF